MSPLFVRILETDWHTWMPAPWVQIALIFISAVCGGIIGGERERREKPAGLRTLMLVCLGSAIFTTAGYSFTSNTGDSGRVAAQIVTGIGFLGAGVILHGRGTISGTTTAATIWVTAATGMLAATGYASGALACSILVRFLLLFVRKFEVHRRGGMKEVDVALEFAADGGKTRVRIERILVDFEEGAVDVVWSSLDELRHEVILKLRLPHHHLCELLAALAEVQEILKMDSTNTAVAKR